MGGSASLAVNATLHKKLAYDPVKDFVPLAHVVGIPFTLVVQPSLPVRSVADLVKLAKEKPGQLAFATSGPGSPAHLQTELLKSMTGIDIAMVPYKGSPPAVTDFLAGQFEAMFVEFPASLALIKDGKMRPLGVSTTTRVPAAPDIAPLAEVGPARIRGRRLADVRGARRYAEGYRREAARGIEAIAALPEIKQKIAGMGMVPIVPPPPSVADQQRYIQTEIDRWGKVIRAAPRDRRLGATLAAGYELRPK